MLNFNFVYRAEQHLTSGVVAAAYALLMIPNSLLAWLAFRERVSGAFIAGSATVIEWLLQRARTYIFSTGSSPIIACALRASLTQIAEGDARRAHLAVLTTQLRQGLAATRWKLLPSPTAIQPIVVGDNHAVVALAEALYARGLWVPGIRPPTVPQGSARLRVSLSAAHTTDHVARLVDALCELA